MEITELLKNKKAIIFDMDGTLIDSMWLWRQIDIDFFGRYGIDFPDDLQKQIEGMSFRQTAEYMKKRYQFPISVEEMMDSWNEMAYQLYSEVVNFKNGAYDFLLYCKENGIKLGIATSNSRYLFDAVRKRLNLDIFFDCMLTGSEVTNGKPAPDVYLQVAERLAVSPRECLVFEDIMPGIESGHNAGMMVCAINDEYSRDDEALKRDAADYYINDYFDLLNEID